jgi:type VI secretion system secreted protein Hcp
VGIYWKTEKIKKGDANEAEHKGAQGWIKLAGFSFGSGRNIATRTGRVADREASTGQVGEITITKEMDVASMYLFMGTCLGAGQKMNIHVTRAGPDKKEITYLKYELDNALLTNYSYGSGGANPVETVTINFTKIKMEYTPADAAAKGTGSIPVMFDMATGTGEGA